MKTVALLILLTLPILVYAQLEYDNTHDEDFSEIDSIVTTGDRELEYGLNGMIGSVTIDNQTYSQIRLMPEVIFGKIGIGLDIDILVDSEGKLRKEDWDEWRDYLYKVLYVRYGDREDRVYFKVGNIRDYTLARGLIFNRYSNMLLYPNVRNLGGFIGINSPLFGLGGELYTHNIYKNEIISARVHATPLSFTDVPYLTDFKIGINMGYDRNVYAKYPDKDEDEIPDVYDKFPNDRRIWLDTDNDGLPDYPFDATQASDDVTYDLDIAGLGNIDHPDDNPYIDVVFPGIVNNYPTFPYNSGFIRDYATPTNRNTEMMILSIDYKIPFVENYNLYLYNYGEFAQIKEYGSGFIFPGFGADFSIFNALLEFRSFGDKFKPGFFDGVYEEERCHVLYVYDNDTNRNVYALEGKESVLDGYKASWGWYGSVLANIQEIFYLKIAFQDMYGEQVRTGKSLWAGVKVMQDYIPRLADASIAYSQRNVHYINFRRLRNTAAQIDGKMTYTISTDSRLVGRFTQRYLDIDNDGIIRGKDEVINTVTFGVEFRF